MRRQCRHLRRWWAPMPTMRSRASTSGGCSTAPRASACNWTKQPETGAGMTSEFSAGNYRFIPAVFQYSSGVAASSGFEVERVRFDKPIALADGFVQIAKYIQAAGRPPTSFCACELRSPAAFTDEGFKNFNLHYVKTLSDWGIYDGETNPVA